MQSDGDWIRDVAARPFAYPGGKIGIRRLVADDEDAFLELVKQSQEFHHPWIQPPDDSAKFQALLERSKDKSFIALAVVRIDSNELVGMVHVSQIVRGAFQSGYCSYWVGAGGRGKGCMSEAMRLTLHFAFHELGLHRLEANVQPQNHASIALVRRCGFVKEGFSEKYLQILGEWKDHERWAIYTEIWEERSLPFDGLPRWI